MAKRNLKDLMVSRTPLGVRETVQPANLYQVHNAAASPGVVDYQDAGLLANQQVGKPASTDAARPRAETDHHQATERMPDVSVQQAGLPASKQTSKPVKKFASYLRDDSIKTLKLIALQEDKNDYEVLQEAVDEYISRKMMK
jgi:hypothetical protein